MSWRVVASILALVTILAAGFTVLRNFPARAESERPNIILILADDLEVEPVSHMPHLQSLLVEQGTTFTNAFVTTPQCCPSRASILRGQYAHNHQVLENNAPQGGHGRFYQLGLDKSTIATWLEDGGYRTIYLGKYLNDYGAESIVPAGEIYVPPGWDEWYGLLGGKYFNYSLNENGDVVQYGTDPEDYLTDVLRDKAIDFISHTARDQTPFFMYLAPKSPHAPNRPAPRHADAFPGVTAPRPPSFNEQDISDKPAWLQVYPPLDEAQVASIDSEYRLRLQTMLAVDEMIEDLIQALADASKLDNTYIVFTSDNGVHLGQHRLTAGTARGQVTAGKGLLYDEDIRVPMIVRGPGVPVGRTLNNLVLNIDLGPTFADLAGVRAPSFIDGQSLRPLLRADPTPATTWRQQFLAETWAPRDPNTYAVRTMTHKYVRHGAGDYELYDLKNDPHELENIYATADRELVQSLDQRLAQLMRCSASACRNANE